MNKRLSIQITTLNRPTELALLLQSLRTQTFQDFNVIVLDDGSNIPINNIYYIQYIIQRLKLEGHNVTILRNEEGSGVSAARQQLVDYYMQNSNEPLNARLDDDVILESDYLEKILEVIDKGYDIASGVTTPFVGALTKREIKYVKPVIGYCELDNKGNIICMHDDCGMQYIEDEILPSPHFRSCAIFKREVFEKINYKSRLSKNGFLEEAVLSFKAILEGFKIGVRTGADAKHLMTPTGGERPTMNMGTFNKEIFKETVKRMYEEHGNFILDYYKKLNIDITKLNKPYTNSFNLFNN